VDINNEQTDGLLNELKLFRDRVDSGNLFQTDGAQQLKAWLPNNARPKGSSGLMLLK